MLTYMELDCDTWSIKGVTAVNNTRQPHYGIDIMRNGHKRAKTFTCI